MKTYNCPMCEVPLTELKGNQMNSDGVTLRCYNEACKQPVEAWGIKPQDAFEVVVHKYGKKKENNS